MDWAERFIKAVVYPEFPKVFYIEVQGGYKLIFSRKGCFLFAEDQGAKSVIFDEINNQARLVWDE
ncbi:hypothetical protein [Sulfuricurvum sp.]|uniref:hypothetical protein n=1 Tax=Sulfuricurvum sp. TaxID=2025608 RepID=UPI002D67628B|nr:hypothetical protein [Sulfuricurvum sp.]HZF69375.1 hypothetical protein [Sulfuricurvum sp.]